MRRSTTAPFACAIVAVVFLVRGTSTPRAARAEEEPNDSIAAATPVDCGFTSDDAQIETADVDYYTLTVPAGRFLRADVDAAEQGSSLDSILQLFDADGVPVQLSDDDPAPGEPPTTDSFVERLAPVATTYFVAVGGHGDGAFDGSNVSSGPYTLHLSCDLPPGEPNDTRAEAIPIACGEMTTAASISLAGDVDFYRLEVTKGAVVSVDLDKVGDRFAPTLDSTLGIFDDAGNRLTVNDDAIAPGEDRSTFSFVELVAPYTGTYFIAVSAWDDLDFDGVSDSSTPQNLTTGDYTLAISCAPVSPGAIVPVPWDERDAGISATDDGAVTYALPFAFPWFGRTITAVSVNTNGLVELLEAGESCAECDDFSTHFDHDHVNKHIDAIFAANDDLVTSVIVEGFAERIEISWIGRTTADTGFADGHPLAFRVLLFEDGRVQWKFFDMAWSKLGGDLFSGIYDEAQNVEREVPGGSKSLKGVGVDKTFQFTPATHTIAAIPWDARDASIAATDDAHLTYALPFTFPWFGRAITAVDVNTNGLAELLENGEACAECEAPLTHSSDRHVAKHIDALFAANDDLETEVVVSGASGLVEIIWVGSTKVDGDFVERELAVKLLLFADGRVRWKFFDLNALARSGDLFSGTYDATADVAEEIFAGSTAFRDEGLHRALEFAGGAEGPPGGPRCDNGFDDDRDQLVDGADPDCHGCGDGIPDPGEACDDGNTTDGDGCDGNCTVTACANGIRSADEQCDPGAAPSGCGHAEICGAPGGESPCTCIGGLAAGVDSFLGYAAKFSKGTLCTALAPQNPGAACVNELDCGGTLDKTTFCAANALARGRSVTLTSALASGAFDLTSASALATPATVNGAAVHDGATHLRIYAIRAAKRRCADQAPQRRHRACKAEADCGGTKRVTSFCVTQPKPPTTSGIQVINALHPQGELTLDAGKPDRLLVPSAKSLIGPITPPDPATIGVEHFACATVRLGKGAAKFPKGLQASAADQLGPAVTYDLLKPSHLCAPADVDGQGVTNAVTYLACYQVRPAKGQIGHPPATGLFVANELGRERLDTGKEGELCLPSTTSLP